MNFIFSWLVILPLVFSDATKTDAAGSLRKKNASGNPVKVLVLTESLCPYCEQFLTNELWPAFQKLGTEVMDVTVIPFGNARVDKEAKTVTCQHGIAECDANTYELCAIEMVKHVEDYLPFLVCNAKNLPPGRHDDVFPPSMFEACAKEAGIWWEALLACHDTESLAWQVNWKASQATPEHPYVPYVLLNNSLMPDDVDFATEICRLYKEQGGDSPNCDDYLSLVPQRTQNPIDPVCRNEHDLVSE